MGKWLKVSIVVAVLLAGAGVVFVPGIHLARQDRNNAAWRADEFGLAQRRSAVEECQTAARMFFDVKWAAACMTQVGEASPGYADGHAECDLPDAKAAVVNAWLNDAEARCTTEVHVGLDR